jgi:F1F0 ATPase subunit 2
MPEALTLSLAGLAGGLLGAVFFQGLWWTVRRGVASPRAALWFLVSGLLRMSLVVAGFLLIGGGRWPRLVAGLAGFSLARLALIRRRAAAPIVHPPRQEAARAP